MQKKACNFNDIWLQMLTLSHVWPERANDKKTFKTRFQSNFTLVTLVFNGDLFSYFKQISLLFHYYGKPKNVPIPFKAKFYFHLHSVKSILTGLCGHKIKNFANHPTSYDLFITKKYYQKLNFDAYTLQLNMKQF